MFDHVDKHKAMLAFGVVTGVVLLFMFMKGKSNAASGAAVPSSSGAAALVGGYTTSQTVYVPTTSYDIHYDTNNGTITNSTINNQTTQSYSPVTHPNPTPPAPIIGTTSGATANPIKAPQYTAYDAAGKPIKSWTSVKGLVDRLSSSPGGTIKDNSTGKTLYTEPQPATYTAYNANGSKIETWSSVSGLVPIVNQEHGAYILDSSGHRQYTSRA